MSGVYIPGMEMPKGCWCCEWFRHTEYWNQNDEADIQYHCMRTGEHTWDEVEGYLPGCPLIPVPDHGRLIDADALVHSYYHAPSFPKLCKAINDAPTIIPAEEGE